jgi:hypothetical protein
MQRKIFEHQALMHEAYLGAGLEAIRALRGAGIIDGATAQAWAQIDSGERDAVRAGNRTLLFREHRTPTMLAHVRRPGPPDLPFVGGSSPRRSGSQRLPFANA